jgi:glycosyltransferase involved in cell wall biosynthesis
LLGDVDPAVVVAHGSEPLKYLVPAMLAHRRPLAYYAIGTYSGAHGRAQEWLWKLLLHRPDVIVAEGHEVRAECIARFGVAGRDVVFVPNGRDPTEFRPADQPKPPTPTRVVFVGALTDGKRPERFLDVVRTLRARGVHLDAAVVGAGPLYDRMVARAESAGVELLGARSDVPDLLRQADILVFPSLPSGEGMPGVLIEAGLSGLATVATDVPGVRSVVHDGVTGFVVGTEDVDAMVRSVARLVDDVELRTSMGRAARAHCTAHYSVDVVARAWSDVLQPLVDGAGRERPHP